MDNDRQNNKEREDGFSANCGRSASAPGYTPVPKSLSLDETTRQRNVLLRALEDLSFECFGVFSTKAPSTETYNRTFKVLDEVRQAIGIKQDSGGDNETSRPTY